MSFYEQLIASLERNGTAGFREKFSDAASARAVAAWAAFIGEPRETLGEDGHAFSVGHVLGEADALRRAKIALSDPRARGVEQDVLEHLANGFEIDDAIRKAASASADAGGQKGDNVIQFPLGRD